MTAQIPKLCKSERKHKTTTAASHRETDKHHDWEEMGHLTTESNIL